MTASSTAGLVALLAGMVLLVGAADVFPDGLLGAERRLRVAPFVLTVALSGFETENPAARHSHQRHGPAGRGGRHVPRRREFPGLVGVGGLISPMRAGLARRFATRRRLRDEGGRGGDGSG